MEFLLKKKNCFLYLILYLSIIFFNKAEDDSYSIYRCGEDDFKQIPLSPDNIAPLKNNGKKLKRLIDSDGFKDFNIYLDLLNFDDEVEKYKLQDKKDLFVTGMQKAIKTLQSLLKVKPISNYVFNDTHLTDIKIYNWNKSMIGSDNKKKGIGMNDLGVDLYIFVRFGDKKELGDYTLATAGPKYYDTLSHQPIVGVVNINREINYSKKNSLNYFEGTIIHEFTHILGFVNRYFTDVFRNVLFKTDKYGIQRAYINSTKVVKVAKKYFNCSTLEGVELENQGGNGTIGSHWEARILLGEYMTGEVYTPDEVISEFTLALLEDTGYYKANYYTGGLMQFGKNKGCEFLNSKCINNGAINSKFSNEFFDNINNEINFADTSCSSGRQSRTYHFFKYYESIPKEYQYFISNDQGGYKNADYCPVSLNRYEETINNYYVGHCSEIGGENYGIKIPYIDPDNSVKYYSSGKIASITGEYHSSNSFCVLSSLISKNISDYKKYSNTLRAVCYQMYCSDRSLTIQINNNYFVCPRAGGKIDALDFDGYLLCPDYNLICSGKVLCNNMFDCVEKKSKLKEIIYDYDSRTTQDYDDIEDEENEEDGYELSTNGKCPINCHQCNEFGECLVCKKMTYLKGKKLCEKCPSNEYSLKGDNICKPCRAGSYLDSESNQCKQCLPGYYSISGATSCKKCPAGTYSLRGSALCFNCPPTLYSLSGASSCRKCEEEYTSLEGSSGCYKKCPRGQYPFGDKCYNCSPGTFSKAGAQNCTKCPAGSYSNSGASSCIQCPAGKYSKEKSSKCDDCQAGTYSKSGSSSCLKCQAGFFSNKGSSQCTICKPGTYSTSGSSSCTTCSAGYYSNIGSSQCIKCKAGTYSSSGSSKCSNCPASFYSNQGSSLCIKCPIGYTSIERSSSCYKKCSAGQYPLIDKCYSCSAGTYSKEGSKYCTKCPAGSYSNSGASSCIQ